VCLKCAARGSRKIQNAKITQKNRHLSTIAQICRAISSQLRHVLTIGKKLLNGSISFTYSHNMVKIGLLMAEVGWGVWGTTANFNGFRVLASLLHRRRSKNGGQPNFAWCLAVSWASTPYIHFGGCCPLTEFCQVQNSLWVMSLAFSYIGSVTARHSSSGRDPSFVAWYEEWN